MSKSQLIYKNGDQYIGTLSPSPPFSLSGQGTYKFKNGSIYQGQFQNNLFEGRGKLIDKLNDLTIIGQFKNGHANGQVRVSYADGGEYEGEVQYGSRSGKGVYRYGTNNSNFVQYQGMWNEDLYDGFGELLLKSGKYRGEFKSGVYHGKGELKNAGFVYVGDFVKGRIEGKGIMKFNGGEYYEGSFQLNKRCGKGEYYYEDGSKYEGYWKDDMRHGKGKMINKNGDWFQGDFQQDSLKGQIFSKMGKYQIVAQMENQMLNGPIQIASQEEKIKIKAVYKNNLKNGKVFMQKKNHQGQIIKYSGQFKQGKELGHLVSYSQRF